MTTAAAAAASAAAAAAVAAGASDAGQTEGAVYRAAALRGGKEEIEGALSSFTPRARIDDLQCGGEE